MQKEIKHIKHFKQSPEEVWSYLTKPELLEQWLGKTDFQPIVGHKFQFNSPYGNHSHCEVLDVQPYCRLSFTWQKNSLKTNTPFNSKVAWTLVPKENGMELQLVHDAFMELEDFMGHETGWGTCLKQMEALINTTHNQ